MSNIKKTVNKDIGSAKMKSCPKCGKNFLTERVFMTCCYCGKSTEQKRYNHN